MRRSTAPGPRLSLVLRIFVAISGIVSLEACGDLTAGGAGEVEIEIIADSVSVASAIAPIEGTLTVGLQIFARRGTREVELTDGVQVLELPLDGSSSMIVSRKTLPSGSYRGERIVFSRIEADVEDGLEVGGEPFLGAVEVELGVGNRVEIPWAVDLGIPEGGVSTLILEMRAPRWLRLLNPELRRVSREIFEAHPPKVRIGP
jgi:hypothetical protein